MLKSHKKGKIALVALFIIAALILASATAMERTHLSSAESGLRDGLAPLKSGAMVVKDQFARIPQFFVGMDSLMAENQQLKIEVARLENEVSNLSEVNVENVELKQMLGMEQEVKNWGPVATTVIARSPDSWYSTITIKGGINKGFAVGMPVVATEGLVGRILSVTEHTAEVLLIVDKEGAVGAKMQLTGTPGVVEGTTSAGNILYMIHIPYEAQVENDQVVITSGLGSIFPAGLRIGYVTNVESYNGGLMLKATLTPFVDFERLENVFVLTKFSASASNSSTGVEAK